MKHASCGLATTVSISLQPGYKYCNHLFINFWIVKNICFQRCYVIVLNNIVGFYINSKKGKLCLHFYCNKPQVLARSKLIFYKNYKQFCILRQLEVASNCYQLGVAIHSPQTR